MKIMNTHLFNSGWALQGHKSWWKCACLSFLHVFWIIVHDLLYNLPNWFASGWALQGHNSSLQCVILSFVLCFSDFSWFCHGNNVYLAWGGLLYIHSLLRKYGPQRWPTPATVLRGTKALGCNGLPPSCGPLPAMLTLERVLEMLQTPVTKICIQTKQTAQLNNTRVRNKNAYIVPRRVQGIYIYIYIGPSAPAASKSARMR